MDGTPKLCLSEAPQGDLGTIRLQTCPWEWLLLGTHPLPPFSTPRASDWPTRGSISLDQRSQSRVTWGSSHMGPLLLCTEPLFKLGKSAPWAEIKKGTPRREKLLTGRVGTFHGKKRCPCPGFWLSTSPSPVCVHHAGSTHFCARRWGAIPRGGRGLGRFPVASLIQQMLDAYNLASLLWASYKGYHRAG